MLSRTRRRRRAAPVPRVRTCEYSPDIEVNTLLACFSRLSITRPLESGLMAKYITIAEFRNTPANIAIHRAFKYNVLQQTPSLDAVLKRHANMILWGALASARRASNKPVRDTALVDLICKLLINTANGDEDKNTTVLRKLFGATTTDEAQIKRLISSSRPESMIHKNYPRSSNVMTWRAVEDPSPENSPQPSVRKPTRRKPKSSEDLDAEANLIDTQRPRR